MPKMQIPQKLEPFLTKKKRFKIAYGGRGGAKSHTFADIFLMKAQTEGAKVGCFREMQNSIEDSVHSLLKDEISRLELQGFDVQNSGIYHAGGGEFRFRGLARNPDAVKSMHGFKYFWGEEAHTFSEESIKILTPTLRTDDSEIWFSMNRKSSEDPMDKRFIQPFIKQLERDGYYEDDLHLIVKINYYDNPWFPDVLEQERQYDYIHLPRANYDHIWEGAPNDHIENSIIMAEWFDACIDAHKKLNIKPRGMKIASHDPSDLGKDTKGYCLRHGLLVIDVQEKDTGDVNEGCDWALDLAIDAKADVFAWDTGGMGVSLKRQVTSGLSGKKMDYAMFNGAEEPDFPDEYYQGDKGKTSQKRKNRDTFKNKRAQYYWNLRDRCYNTYRAVTQGEYINPDEMISFSSGISEINKLRSEICRIPRKHNGSGTIQIATKAEMKMMKIDSPNLADSVMMSLIPPTNKADDSFLQAQLPKLKGIV